MFPKTVRTAVSLASRISLHGRTIRPTTAGGDMIRCQNSTMKALKNCMMISWCCTKWVSPPYNADGWRLDVAADLGYSPEMNHEFWRDFRKAVKTANPDAIILAEHYGDSKEWLQKGDQWDTL